MLFLSLSLVFTLVGMLTADRNEKIEACLEGIDFETMEDFIEAADNNEIEVICTKILPLLYCVDNILEDEIGLKMADVAKLIPDEDMGKLATLFVNLQSLLEELCDEESELHKTYTKHSPCFRTIPHSRVEECRQESMASFDAYKAFQNKIEDEADDGDYFNEGDNRECLVGALNSACLAADIHDTCGMEAFEIYQTVVKRTNVFRLAFCSEEALDELKTKFLDSLDLQDERKDLFRLAFDLRKRRK